MLESLRFVHFDIHQRANGKIRDSLRATRGIVVVNRAVKRPIADERVM